MGISLSTDKLEDIQQLPSTTASSTHSSQSNIQIEHLETFNLVWFDEKRIDDQSQLSKKRLRQLSTNFIYFDEVKSCEHWLKSRPTDEKILLIVSGKVGQKIVPLIHHLTSIIGIYVFYTILENTSGWIQPYSKIRATVFTPEELIQQISKDQRYFENIEDSKIIQIFKAPSHTRILQPEYASIICYQLFIEILLSPPYLPSSPSPEPFIAFLRQSISNDEESLNLIKQFELTYKKENAMKWLIDNTPIARFLNKALREQNIKILFYLRFFLNDISNQLMSNQLSSIRVYRKEMMSRENVVSIGSNVNHHLMINGFLLTSIKPFDTSIIDKNENGYENVFIEIDAQQQDGTLPFAYVPNSMNTGENDPGVLFMCGSIFKIISLESNINSSCRLRLSLVGSKELNILNEKQIKLRKTNDLLMVVELLDQSNQSNKANIYCQELLRELPRTHRLIPYILDKMNMNSKVESISLTHSKYVLIGLGDDNLSPSAVEMLNVVKRLSNNSISSVNNYSDINLNEMKGKTSFIFTNSQMCSSVRKVSEQQPRQFFVLGNEEDKDKETKYFDNSEDLIFELIDKLYRSYIWEVNNDQTSGYYESAKQKQELANQIHKQIKQIYRTFSSNVQPSIQTETTIIWLKFNDQNDRIITNTQKLFQNIVSFLIMIDCQQFFSDLCTNELNQSIFLIIDDNYTDISIETIKNFENIKKIYYYGQKSSKGKENNIFDRLILDLTFYYNELANQFEDDDDQENAKKMFLKAKKLCEICPKS